MRRLRKFLLANLVVALALAASAAASAPDSEGVCQICQQTQDCFSCCRCGGGTVAFCTEECMD
jgi:hypothetical protein